MLTQAISCSRPTCKRDTTLPYRTCEKCRANGRIAKRRYMHRIRCSRFLVPDDQVHSDDEDYRPLTKAKVWNLRVLSGDYTAAELQEIGITEL